MDRYTSVNAEDLTIAPQGGATAITVNVFVFARNTVNHVATRYYPSINANAWFVPSSTSSASADSPPGWKRERRKDYHLALGGDGPRLVLYIRVSSSKQAKGDSPEAQEEDLLALAMPLKPSHVYVLFDYAKTGMEATRRKTGLIQKMQKAGLVDELLVRHVDRAGRESFDLDELCMPFIKRGGKIRTLKRVYEHNADDYVALANEFVCAEKQSIHDSETMRSSKEKNFKEGNWNHSSYPLGYREKIVTSESGQKRKWIEKDPAWEGLMPRMLDTLLLTGSFSDVTKVIPSDFPNRPKRDRVVHGFKNPIIFGRPRMMEATRVDELLRYFPDDVEPKLNAIFVEIKSRYEEKADEVFSKILAEDFTALAPLLQRVHEHAIECGCHFVLNGTFTDEQGPHLSIICVRREHELTFPLPRRKGDRTPEQEWASFMEEFDRAVPEKLRSLVSTATPANVGDPSNSPPAEVSRLATITSTDGQEWVDSRAPKACAHGSPPLQIQRRRGDMSLM